MNSACSTEPVWAVGLMTGTVLDGNIDVALIKTDGVDVFEFGAYCLSPYSSSTIDLLREAVDRARQWQFNGAEPDVFGEATKQLTLEQSHAVQELLGESGLAAADVGVVGFHGQTVLHHPPVDMQLGQTRQLGDGSLMAATLGIPVVNDFRTEDMQCGGHGAPLCAIYHQALLQQVSAGPEKAVLNLGGIGNLSWWDGVSKLVAFDTGPANAPINDFVRRHTAGKMDVDGQLAASGRVNEEKLHQHLSHAYFHKGFPKSLDRFDFSSSMAEGESLEDGVALLTAFSAAAVGKGLDLLPNRPREVIVCGGGRHNPSLLNAISKYANVIVSTAENYGWRGDAVEAECFAYLAVRAMRQLPISFPTTTGAMRAVSGGVLHL